MNERQLEEVREVCEGIIDRVSDVFVGNRLLLRKLLAAALANGHVLFEDYPGLGKTLLAKVFSRAIGTDTKRVQFTPDLLPSDIIGVNVWRQNEGEFQLVRGPVFTNVLLADEDQPRSSQDPGCVAGGHGGEAGYHRRFHHAAGHSIPGHSHPEPD